MKDTQRVASDHLLHSTTDDYDLNAEFVAGIDLDRAAAIVEVLERDYIQSQSAAIEQAAPLAEVMVEAWHEHLAGLSADEIKRLEAMTAERSGIMEHDDRDAGKWK